MPLLNLAVGDDVQQIGFDVILMGGQVFLLDGLPSQLGVSLNKRGRGLWVAPGAKVLNRPIPAAGVEKTLVQVQALIQHRRLAVGVAPGLQAVGTRPQQCGEMCRPAGR